MTSNTRLNVITVLVTLLIVCFFYEAYMLIEFSLHRKIWP